MRRLASSPTCLHMFATNCIYYQRLIIMTVVGGIRRHKIGTHHHECFMRSKNHVSNGESADDDVVIGCQTRPIQPYMATTRRHNEDANFLIHQSICGDLWSQFLLGVYGRPRSQKQSSLGLFSSRYSLSSFSSFYQADVLLLAEYYTLQSTLLLLTIPNKTYLSDDFTFDNHKQNDAIFRPL